MMSAAQVCATSRADTPDTVTVVDDAYGNEDRGGDQQSPSARGLHGGHRRNEDADEHRDAADQRNLADMLLATAGLVSDAKTKRERTQPERENHCYCKRQRSRQREPHGNHLLFSYGSTAPTNPGRSGHPPSVEVYAAQMTKAMRT